MGQERGRRPRLTTALGEVCFGKEETHPLEATVDRYFSPDYEQHTDGETTDRAGFVAHVSVLRSLVRGVGSRCLRGPQSGGAGRRSPPGDRDQVRRLHQRDRGVSLRHPRRRRTAAPGGRGYPGRGRRGGRRSSGPGEVIGRGASGAAPGGRSGWAPGRDSSLTFALRTRLASLRLSEVGPRRGSSSGDTNSPSLSCRGGVPTEKETTA